MKLLSKLGRAPRFWGMLFILATITLAYLSLFTSPTIRIGPDIRNRTAHFLAYFIYSAIGITWRAGGKPDESPAKRFLVISIPTAAYGALLEWAQFHLPHRDADPVDGLCNILGALTGSVAGPFIIRVNAPHPRSR